ncbi:MAG: hypothetical protein C4296_02470 [Gemmataceae bacterium]
MNGEWILFFLVFARSFAFVAALPLWGGTLVPRLIKIHLALGLAFFELQSNLPSGWFNTAPFRSLHSSVLILAMMVKEALFGWLLAYVFGLYFVLFRIAGQLVSQEMGMNLAEQSLPDAGIGQGNAVTQIFESIGTLLFYTMNIHHYFFLSYHSSILLLGPVQDLGLTPHLAVQPFTNTLQWSLTLVAPILSGLFLATIALFLANRVAPQLNLFSIGLTGRICAGLFLLFVSLPQMVWAACQLLHKMAILSTFSGRGLL